MVTVNATTHAVIALDLIDLSIGKNPLRPVQCLTNQSCMKLLHVTVEVQRKKENALHKEAPPAIHAERRIPIRGVQLLTVPLRV